jgi:hypothetical protein
VAGGRRDDEDQVDTRRSAERRLLQDVHLRLQKVRMSKMRNTVTQGVAIDGIGRSYRRGVELKDRVEFYVVLVLKKIKR